MKPSKRLLTELQNKLPQLLNDVIEQFMSNLDITNDELIASLLYMQWHIYINKQITEFSKQLKHAILCKGREAGRDLLKC